jgi:PTS system ascorbate-specific IIA component
MLSDYLTEKVIRLHVAAGTWQDAVWAAGSLLVADGKCTLGYIAAVDEMGPYMVLAPGLALAHARPENGVLAMGISLVTLAQPVEFGSEDNDPVSLVIAFGGVDHTSHLGMLASLANFLGDDGRRAALVGAETVAQVLEQIQGY